MMVNWSPFLRYQNALTLGQWALVLVTISVGIWTIARLRSYFREDSDDADDALEMLAQFSELHQQGGLSDDEFRLIKSRLSRVAQEALTANRMQSTNPVEPGSMEQPQALNDNSTQSPDQIVITEKEEKSEGRSDNETN